MSKLLLDFQVIKLEGGGQKPTFKRFVYRDVNPLGGTDKQRILYAPNEAMKELHNQLISFLRGLGIEMPFAFGALPHCSPRENVKMHRENRFFYLTDIHSAYPSVDLDRMTAVLSGISEELKGEGKEIRTFLKRFCFSKEGGLATGAPASPDLFNLYSHFLVDRELGKFCKLHGITYTRYLDDLTLSHPSQNIGKRKRKFIREVIIRAGFTINHRKSVVADLKKGPIVINGIGLEFGGRMFLPRHYMRKIRGVIHRAMTEDMLKNKKGKLVPAETIVAGMMGCFFGSIIPFQQLYNRTEIKLLNMMARFYRHLTQQKLQALGP